MQRNGYWALTWINSVKFAERLIAFAVVETSFSLAQKT
jgi:hypothetical protein